MEEVDKLEATLKDQSYLRNQDKILLQPLTYLRQNPGDDIIVCVSRVFNHWLNIPSEKFRIISEIMDLLNDFILLVDDIQDDSKLRRGIPVAHSIYGIPNTLNTGIYSLVMALDKVHALNNPEATKVFTEELLKMIRGQGMDVHWKEGFILPEEFDYKMMAVQKAACFMIHLRLMQLFSTNKKDLSRLINILGLYFIIFDDFGNLYIKEVTDSKGFFEDLSEGKFSFPIIHAIRNEKDDPKVRIMLKNRTQDVDVKKYCVSLLEKIGSLKYTRDVLDSLDKLAREEAAKFGPNPYFEGLLNRFLQFKISYNNSEMGFIKSEA